MAEKRAGTRQPASSQPVDPPGTLNETRWTEVLNAAAELFAEKGYAETSVQDVATRAGLVNKGSLYYYIKTKEDLLWQLALQLHTDVLDRIREEEPQLGEDAATRLSSFVGWWTRHLMERTPQYGWVGREMRSLSPEHALTLMRLRRQFRSYLLRILRDGIEDGSFEPDLDPNFVVHSIVSLVQGTAEWYQPRGRGSLEDVIAWYQQMVLRGVSRRGTDVR